METDRLDTGRLLRWYEEIKRPLPWRADREPYHVWVSEIMCQQTRVEAARGYYLRFLEALPDVASLAACPEERLSKLWEGLGYYSRARNLRRAAQLVVERYGGVFPSDYDAIRSLPGIGDYTAAAVSSICFGLPRPAVDGNVLRVFTRLTASRMDVLRESTKKAVREALIPVFENADSGELNQALMELGALVCVPNREPDCAACPLRERCLSAADGLWRELPVRGEKKPKKVEVHTVCLLICEGRFALRKREESGLLAGLWEFPNLPGRLSAQEALDAAERWRCRPRSVLRRTERKHVFTHRVWELPAYLIECAAASPTFEWAEPRDIRERYSLPTAFRQFWDEIEEASDKEEAK